MLRSVSDWVAFQWKRLLAIEDAPGAVARGVVIGVIIGFSPLYSIKTLLAILIAWAFRSSKLAAVIVVTLHDVLIPLEPILMRWQYALGHWLLTSPHEWPAPLGKEHLAMHWREWISPEMLLGIIWPTLVGSLIMSIPLAIIVYRPVRRMLERPVIRESSSPSATHKPE